ncbi:MAG: hypothetical protein JKY15_00160 [Deltaproteobacteria bacterium]|nr:hypothetical protein [Deltaproteobacteria bacterium]
MPIAPVSGGAQQVQQALKEAQKQVKPSGPGQENFGQVLQGKQAGATQGAQSVGQINQVNLQKSQKVPTAIKSLLNHWSRDSNSMNKIMKVALSGQKFNPQELIALQNATYKVSFELETMSKLVETATGAVKTTMQTQV